MHMHVLDRSIAYKSTKSLEDKKTKNGPPATREPCCRKFPRLNNTRFMSDNWQLSISRNIKTPRPHNTGLHTGIKVGEVVVIFYSPTTLQGMGNESTRANEVREGGGGR